jgi:hypothetical protein
LNKVRKVEECGCPTYLYDRYQFSHYPPLHFFFFAFREKAKSNLIGELWELQSAGCEIKLRIKLRPHDHAPAICHFLLVNYPR